MKLNLLDEIGNWNPQLFRELKGRLKLGNVAIATMLSVGAQVLLFLSLYVQPDVGTLDDQNFWLNLFVYLSIFSTIALFVAGTYMLVSDLDKEERHGTLNFIRLSPQSASTIFIGKILGVPILVYLTAILAVPLHVYSGLSARIPAHHILCFYIATIASCALFYSSAMLFGLTTCWLAGLQAWLASTAVLGSIALTFAMPSIGNAADFLTFLSPAAVLKQVVYLVNNSPYSNLDLLAGQFDCLQWFHLPVGEYFISSTALSFLICAVATYWIWQGWQRRFPNPSTTVWSKRQSYWLVICYQLIILGFGLQSNIGSGVVNNNFFLLIPTLIFFLASIAALTPERQALSDWVRYRQKIVPSERKLWRRYPILDLIWSEKSPAIVAIAIELLISILILTPCLLPNKPYSFLLMIPCVNLILIYATIAQLCLFTKSRNREIWAACTVGGAIILPIVITSIFSMFSITHQRNFTIFWSSVFPIFNSWWVSGDEIVLFAIVQLTVLVLLNLQLRRQLRLARESASKALLKA